MALTKRERESRTPDLFDRLFRPWLMHPLTAWPTEMEGFIKVEEYQENGTLVVKAEMPGLDPDKDVEVTVSDGMLHIGAERREEEKSEGKDYYRQELRYGSFSRDLPLPEGVSEADIEAAYKDGILKIKIPNPKGAATQAEPRKVPVSKS